MKTTERRENVTHYKKEYKVKVGSRGRKKKITYYNRQQGKTTTVRVNLPPHWSGTESAGNTTEEKIQFIGVTTRAQQLKETASVPAERSGEKISNVHAENSNT